MRRKGRKNKERDMDTGGLPFPSALVHASEQILRHPYGLSMTPGGKQAMKGAGDPGAIDLIRQARA